MQRSDLARWAVLPMRVVVGYGFIEHGLAKLSRGPHAFAGILQQLGVPLPHEIRHKTPIGAWDGGFAPGLDPARGDYASFANFSDPDGNSWVLQERGYRSV